MPRLTNALPRYRKHRAGGQAVVTLGGRDHHLGPQGAKASRTLCDRLVAEWLANGRATPEHRDVALCSRYLRFAEEYYTKNGRQTGATAGIRASIRYLREWYGRDPAESFGPVALKALRERTYQGAELSVLGDGSVFEVQHPR